MAYADTLELVVDLSSTAGTDSIHSACIPSQIAGASSNAVFVLKGVDLVAEATTAANGTNYAVITGYGADGSTSQFSRPTASVALTVDTVYAQTLTGGSNADFNPGDLIKVAVDQSNGTGAAVEGSLVFYFEKRR